MKNRNMKKKSGQIFLMTLLVLSTVLTAGVILITIFTRDLKLSNETTTSAQALYVADSVIEEKLYQKFKNGTSTLAFIIFNPQPTFQFCEVSLNNTTNPCNSTCEAVSSQECLKATGTIGAISRGLEVDF